MPTGVYERTEQYRKKMSESHKGQIPWNKGLTKETDERLKKSSEIHKGQIPWIKNRHHTEESKKKISNAGKSKVPWNKGLTNETDERVKKRSETVQGSHRTKATRQKMSEALKGINIWMKGRKHSAKTKEKMSRTHKARLTRGLIKKILRRRIPNSLEEKFQSIIDKFNLPYKYVGDGSFILGHYNPDFINTNDEKIAIEVYAIYHKLKHNVSIEDWKEKRTRTFRKFGWDIIYFDETEVNEDNVLKYLGGET